MINWWILYRLYI